MKYKFADHDFVFSSAVFKELDLNSTQRIVLLDSEGLSKKDTDRNVYMLSSQGQVLWQVQNLGLSDGRPSFWSNVWLDQEGALWGYHFSGWEAQISIEDGGLIKKKFVR